MGIKEAQIVLMQSYNRDVIRELSAKEIEAAYVLSSGRETDDYEYDEKERD